MLQWPCGNSTNPGSRKNLCDPEELWTAERLVDEFPVALSQHFPRIWSCLCTKFCNRKSILLFVIMCTERMFVFADLSSPALDSSTEHLKVEITQDYRQVYWAVIQWHSESSAMLFPVHCSGFSPDQHYWEVIVQEKSYWVIGVMTGTLGKKAIES